MNRIKTFLEMIKVEKIKLLIACTMCIIGIISIAIGHIKFEINDRKYWNELREKERLEAERKAKKLENLKLDTFTFNLNSNEKDMLNYMIKRTNRTESQFLRESIKDLINQ